MEGQHPQPGFRMAVQAFAMGFVLCLVVSGLKAAYQEQSLSTARVDILVTSLVAGGVLALGGAIAGRLFGAIGGGVLGIVVALVLAVQFLPPSERVEVSDEPLPEGDTFKLTGPTVDGSRFDLADYRGKVVLVDFWATWCLPCRAELPHLRDAYRRYHDQGFEIVGVSLDHSRNDLTEYLRENQISWPQIFHNDPGTRGGSNPLARQYNVTGIPMTFLIDQKGRLVARDLRGKDIDQVVSRVLTQEGRYYRVQARQQALLMTLAAGALVGAALGAVLHRRLLTANRPPSNPVEVS